jgi:hypothetical protein
VQSVKSILTSKKRKGAISAHLVLSSAMERARMNKEYLIAKADLCKDLAIEQLSNGENEEGVKNLKRMIRGSHRPARVAIWGRRSRICSIGTSAPRRVEGLYICVG